jgi:hypothetical protein
MSGGADEELVSTRIAEEDTKLPTLIAQRDALA